MREGSEQDTHHHAELFVGPHETCLACIPEGELQGPDVELVFAEKLTIELARGLSMRAQGRPVERARRHFVVSAREFTHEAQNALLKLLEDPPESARFSLIVPRASLLLPTLRSRLSVRVVASESLGEDDAHAFLALSYRDRLAHVAALQKAKDVTTMRALIAGIERVVATREASERRAVLSDVVLSSRYAEIRGGSPKMLLEHLALSLPQSLPKSTRRAEAVA